MGLYCLCATGEGGFSFKFCAANHHRFYHDSNPQFKIVTTSAISANEDRESSVQNFLPAISAWVGFESPMVRFLEPNGGNNLKA